MSLRLQFRPGRLARQPRRVHHCALVARGVQIYHRVEGRAQLEGWGNLQQP